MIFCISFKIIFFIPQIDFIFLYLISTKWKSKITFVLSLNKEEDHFNGTINLPIQTLQSTQLISQTNGETNSEVLDIDVNFENYLDEDASGGIMLESVYVSLSVLKITCAIVLSW